MTAISKVVDLECWKAPDSGKTIALCHGVFDLFHPGHLEHLRFAKKLADTLVVSITSDRFVGKGPGRPVFDERTRADFIAHLNLVDFVVIADSSDATAVISTVKPAFFVKGDDYRDLESDQSGRIILEKRAVEACGGQLVFSNGMTSSSSRLINKFFSPHRPEAERWLGGIRSSIVPADVTQALDRVGNLRVLVVGETIVDCYQRVDSLGKVSKDPILAFREKDSEAFVGGAAAIARNLSGLGIPTTLLTMAGDDPDWEFCRRQLTESNVEVHPVVLDNAPTIRKTRFLDIGSGTKVFETYKIEDQPMGPADVSSTRQTLAKLMKDADLIIVADFGHDFLVPELIEELSKKPDKCSLVVNTQSNAHSRGFNHVGKYPSADFVFLNGSELDLEFRSKSASVREKANRLIEITGAKWVCITQGKDGLLLVHHERGEFVSPAISSNVVDRVGAGDMVLSIVAPLIHAGVEPKLVGLFAAVVGNLAIGHLGNSKVLTKEVLSSSVTALIK